MFPNNNLKKANLIFVSVISLSCILLLYIPTGFENAFFKKNHLREKAKVISVNNADLKKISVVTIGTQEVEMEILSGEKKGTIIKGSNVLLGQLKLDKVFKKGDTVLAVLKTDEHGDKILTARADDYYRIDIAWILFALFALFLVLFARIIGFKALLSFIFTALCFWKLLIPLYLKGYPPIFVGFSIVILTTIVIILLINGFKTRGFVALLGSIAGVSITSVLALIFDYYFRIPGTVKEFSETILYAGFLHLDMGDIFIASIFISAAGAVMDVAMDISAAQNELKLQNPGITRNELIRSGFRIAYPVLSTMTTTLLFAYSGSFIFIFMSFMSKGTPAITVFNTNYIAAEVLHTLVGSFGLVLVAPITAIIGGYLYTIEGKRNSIEEN